MLKKEIEMATKWEIRGEKLVADLKLADSQSIEVLAIAVMDEIIEAYDKINSRKTPMSEIRKKVLEAFPDTEHQINDCQYFTNSGKGSFPRYQHLALKYITLSQEDWNAIGDHKRKEYLKSKSIETTPTQATDTTSTQAIEMTTTQAIESTSTQAIEPTQIKEIETRELTKLSNLKIEQFEFDSDTLEIVQNALKNSDKSLAEYVKQACRVYGNIVNGRAKADTDLSSVPTSALLDSEVTEYKTHPKKIEELTKRAIKAIMIHNDEKAPETEQKWFLSATAINGLTGSRVQSVHEILQDYEQMVKDHNNKHKLTAYTNRGNAKNRDIKLEIPMASLVPNGLDL